MIRSLRKRHLQVWVALAIIIPIGILSALVARPRFPTDRLLQPAASIILPVILKTVDSENYTVRVRGNTDTTALQLEWINKNTLTHPTATIYSSLPGARGLEGATLIGRIEARGIYYFDLKPASIDHLNIDAIKLILYDFIHQKTIDTIGF